ncbi:2,3-bisphosphoglycerate-dependent phosphoglycerate mutase [uncultured archaeon]|nr:2,3-bisphosphoglycerate-dependent phosphoglycerate mutase [uncultured archaeon]
MMAKIYLFRHGQTHFNLRKRFTGWMDADWTGKGKRNADITAKKLRKKHIDVAFETSLIRSKRTLKEVLKYHPECKLILRDDRMMERCYGDLQMHSHAAFIRKFGQKLFDKYHRAYNFPPPDGESVRMVEGRVKSFIKDLLAFIKKYKVNVAISAHGNSMRPFRRYFEKVSVKQMMRWEMPYDDYFEYEVKVSAGPAPNPSRSSWKSVLLPAHVKLATDKHNVFKKYY